MTLLDIMEGRQFRDAGMDQVLGNQDPSWIKSYRRQAEMFLVGKAYGDTFTGEDVRMYVRRYIPTPSHPNAWGAAARSVLTAWKKQGMIEEYGMGTSKDSKSHATRLVLYRVLAA